MKLSTSRSRSSTGPLRGTRLYPSETQNPKLKTNRGFTLLLAALVASIVLSISTSIFVIAQKQIILSSIGRDSQFAFYAADTGAECALYWDTRHDYFSTTTPSGSATCDNQTLVISGRLPTYPATMSFELNFLINGDGIAGTADDAGYCAEVSVKKDVVDPHTTIHTDGYSTDCTTIGTNPRALQRSVELRY